MLLSRGVPLAPWTTLRLGGRASRVAVVASEADVVEALRSAADEQEEVFVLGGGSNVVVADGELPGLVVRMNTLGVSIERGRDAVTLDVAAGEEWDALVARCVDEGFVGLEALSGIPGFVGATPIQNVGAYGREVSEAITSVRAYDRDVERFVELDAAACAFGYRASLFRGERRHVITRVRFRLGLGDSAAPVRYAELARALGAREGDRPRSGAVRDAVLALRRGKGMVVDPADPDSVSVGSFFVNPTVDAEQLAALERRTDEAVPRFASGARFKVPAAWLIERAGFAKGYARGKVGISGKHALALVHHGGGTTAELLALAREIRDGVRRRFGVELRPEPVFLGCAL